MSKYHVNDNTALCIVTLHPAVSRYHNHPKAKRPASEGLKALDAIRNASSRAARAVKNAQEDVRVAGFSDAILPKTDTEWRTEKLRIALADHTLPVDLRRKIALFLD